MAGLHGDTRGVGSDIVDYLTAVALHFKLTINVTSGYRSAADQGKAMLKNWRKLKRGKVYSRKNLPEAQRQQLDLYYEASKAGSKLKSKDRSEAKASFLTLAADQLGTKSRHCSGRAVDVTQASVTPAAYRAITFRLTEITEGRGDIYHFESIGKVPPVSKDDEKSWDKLSTASLSSSAGNGRTPTGADVRCVCLA